MLVRNSLETDTAAYVNQAQSANDRKDISPEKNAKEQEKAAELTLTNRIRQIAEENVLASESDVMDVARADDMIREANKNILNQAQDAVKVQSGQSVATVMELLK